MARQSIAEIIFDAFVANKDTLWQGLRATGQRGIERRLFCRKETAIICTEDIRMNWQLEESLQRTANYLRARIKACAPCDLESLHLRLDGTFIWVIVYLWV